jgi:2-polyprenyl-3-methyl-5-hydroxy-6-metoxy-1,4-benzoquinol methylase
MREDATVPLYFDQIADTFLSGYSSSPDFRERYDLWVNLIKKYCRDSFLVYDFGCGPGLFSVLAAKLARNVVGFDGSEKMIELCNKSKDKYQLTNARFINEKLPIEPGKYDKSDLIICSSVIEYITDYEKFIGSLNFYLKDKGYLIISFPNRESLYRKFEYIKYFLFKKPDYYKYVSNAWGLDEAINIFARHDFKYIESQYYAHSPFLSRMVNFVNKRLSDNLIVAVFCKEK